MGIRTGQQYLDKLNSMAPQIMIDGEMVTGSVAGHPSFANVARTYARLFDMQHERAHADALTYDSPTTGEKVGASFLVPRTREDLAHRRAAIRT
jgi:4-hydroxyphenylacetate 3-monooxygenase